MARTFVAVFAILSLQWLAVQAALLPWKPLGGRQAAETCTNGATIPDLWSVSGLFIAYTHNELVAPGNATFTITNTRTKFNETLQCNLRSNYACSFSGTPGDKDLSVWLQLNLAASITITQLWPCEGKSASVAGTVQLDITCTSKSIAEGRTCTGETGVGSGEVTISAEPGVDSGLRRRGVPAVMSHQLEPIPTVEEKRSGQHAHVAHNVVTPEDMVQRNKLVGDPALQDHLATMAKRARDIRQALAARQQAKHQAKAEKEAGTRRAATRAARRPGAPPFPNAKGVEEEREAKRLNEKKFIDQMEHRLCSPSCLRERGPAPTSGDRWTKGKPRT